MKTANRMSAWLGAALAAAILFGARGADAHEYFVGKGVPLPEGQDGKRFIQISVGETVTLTVANSPGQSCSADIAAAGFNAAISVTSPQAPGPVATREFRIRGEGIGITEIDLTVQGVDPCTEDSHNPIVVQVLPSEDELLRRFAGAGKSEGKILKATLKTGLGELGAYSREVLDAFADGTVEPDIAARGLLDGWYQAYAGGWFAARDTLRNLANYGDSELVSAGWAECTSPLRFAEGSGGAFDVLRRGARVSLDGFHGKLEKQIASDIAGYRKIGLGYGINFTGGYELRPYPDLDVSGPTRSERAADASAPLRIGYVGAATWSNESNSMSCFWVAGLGDLSGGSVRVDLWDGEGLVDTKLAPLESLGIWDAMFEDLVAGKTYRATVKYEGGDPGHDTAKTFLPGLRLNF
jgi:hypothetical protein